MQVCARASVCMCMRVCTCMCVFLALRDTQTFCCAPPSPYSGFSAGQLPNCAAVLLRSLGFGSLLSFSLPGPGALCGTFMPHATPRGTPTPTTAHRSALCSWLHILISRRLRWACCGLVFNICRHAAHTPHTPTNTHTYTPYTHTHTCAVWPTHMSRKRIIKGISGI